MLKHLRLMARYNRWANRRLYAACDELADAEYHRPRQAFFGSIHGTLTHLLVGDRLWLARILNEPPPHARLDEQPYASFGALSGARGAEDRRMIELTAAMSEEDLRAVVRYRRLPSAQEIKTPLHLCWLHIFNHQTHHRGQVHDQLSQTDVPPPPLDLIYYLRENE